MDQHDPILAGLIPPQAEAAMHDCAILVLAGAGTGKIRTLTAAVAWRIARQAIAPNRVLAVTFTNKATAEMTARIRGMLAGQATPTWTGTFHGLAARQFRVEPEVAGLRPGFEILDADDSKRTIRRTAAATRGMIQVIARMHGDTVIETKGSTGPDGLHT